MLKRFDHWRTRALFSALVLLFSGPSLFAQSQVQFIYTSDLHFGLRTKGSFQGSAGPVDALLVNRRMVQAMNRLSALAAPGDHGVRAGLPFGPFDFLAITGDIANRQEVGPPAIQSAGRSWAQFRATFGGGLELRNREGKPLPLFLTPGNHDISNAIGYPLPLDPPLDATVLVELHNAIHPADPITPATFEYGRHRVFYTRDFAGVHFVFLNLWPDSEMRARIDADIQALASPASTPVILLMHMPPRQEGKNFTDPASSGNHFVFSNGFQNLLPEKAEPGATARSADGLARGAVKELNAFLAAHRTIVAWFHGHENWNEFSTWTGGSARLPVFRVDSPLKGALSSLDERRLSFQVVSIDRKQGLMTVRECLWNSTGTADGPIAWGEARTVSLRSD